MLKKIFKECTKIMGILQNIRTRSVGVSTESVNTILYRNSKILYVQHIKVTEEKWRFIMCCIPLILHITIKNVPVVFDVRVESTNWNGQKNRHELCTKHSFFKSQGLRIWSFNSQVKQSLWITRTYINGCPNTFMCIYIIFLVFFHGYTILHIIHARIWIYITMIYL